MELHKPKNLYELLTLNMEQRFANRVAFRWYDADQDVVVEKHFGEYAQDIRRMVAYLKAEVPDIKGRRIVLLSRNCYEFCVASYGQQLRRDPRRGRRRDHQPEKDLARAGI